MSVPVGKKTVRPPPGFAAKPSAKVPPLGLITKQRVELLGTATEIGEGTYGRVLKYNTTKGSIAVKVSDSVLSGVNSSLLKEAATLTAVGRHPNIVALLDMYVTNTQTGIVLPLAQQDLQDLIDDGPVDMPTVKIFTLQLLHAIAWTHSKDLIHGDVKPGNALVYKDKQCPTRAVLGDFGSARTSRCFEREEPRFSGTPLQMPPEVIMGGAYTNKGDLWALGCTIVEMITSVAPFDVDTEDASLVDILRQQFKILGTPSEETWPGVTALPSWPKEYNYDENKEDGLEDKDLFATTITDDTGVEDYESLEPKALAFVKRLLVLNPSGRANPLELLNDKWLDEARAYVDGVQCLKLPTITTVDCVVALRNRQAVGSVVFPYSPSNKVGLYGWIASVQGVSQSTDRVKALSIYLYEHSNSKRVLSGDPNKDKAQVYLAACFLLSSLLLAKEPIRATTMADYTYNIATPAEVAERVREVLTAVGLDLYVATSYDVLLTLVTSYGPTTADTSLSLLQLSYYTGISRHQPEVVALACIRLGCVFAKEKFLHTVRVEEIGTKLVDSAEKELVADLSKYLSADIPENEKAHSTARRGAFATRYILGDIPAFSKAYPSQRIAPSKLQF